MPTYEVTCSVCNKAKWPVLQQPLAAGEGYVCALCRMVGPTAVQARQEASQRGQLTRARKAAGGGS